MNAFLDSPLDDLSSTSWTVIMVSPSSSLSPSSPVTVSKYLQHLRGRSRGRTGRRRAIVGGLVFAHGIEGTLVLTAIFVQGEGGNKAIPGILDLLVSSLATVVNLTVLVDFALKPLDFALIVAQRHTVLSGKLGAMARNSPGVGRWPIAVELKRLIIICFCSYLRVEGCAL